MIKMFKFTKGAIATAMLALGMAMLCVIPAVQTVMPVAPVVQAEASGTEFLDGIQYNNSNDKLDIENNEENSDLKNKNYSGLNVTVSESYPYYDGIFAHNEKLAIIFIGILIVTCVVVMICSIIFTVVFTTVCFILVKS